MPRPFLSIKSQIFIALVIGVLFTWLSVAYELNHSRNTYQREIEQATIFQAQAYAENTLATIKRLDEVVLDLRDYWTGDMERFAELVQRRRQHLGDIAFQVSIIDAEGYLVYSNLAAPNDRTYLGEREHFRIHKERQTDQLFISKPLKGKVSGKWSIQFTRPIFTDGRFGGVIVVSASPETFATFLAKLGLSGQASSTLVADSGYIMAHYPDNENVLGKTISDAPFLVADAPVSGAYSRSSQIDGIERTYGFYRVPEYGLSFVIGQPVSEALQPYFGHRKTVVAAAILTNAILALLIGLLSHSLTARAAAETELTRSQAMLRSAIDTIGEAFVIYDEHDRLAYCNERYLDYYRTSADLLVPGRTFEEIIRTGAERGQYQEAIGRVDEWVASRMAAHLRGNSDLIQPVADGRWLRIRERKTPEGYIVGFRIDITELYKAKEAAEVANIAKSRFLATMSHEIRTPMNGILGMAQMLLMPTLTEQERHDYARTILNSGQTLLSLLNDILDLSKIEAEKLDLVPTDTDPGRIVTETAALFAGAAEAKGLHIEAAWHGPQAQLYRLDGTRVRQMLSNLISNAIKFTASGTIRIEAAEVDRRGGQSLLQFSVIDNGIGIAGDKQVYLFKPFSQADSSITRQFGGTGLGLSIVRSLARMMGGDVGVESEPSKGSTFWFRIRAERGALDTPTETSPMPPHASQDGGTIPPRRMPLAGKVLVVEDNAVNRKLILALLKKLGVDAACVENGQEALEVLDADDRPDLVLMDIQMPVMDGITASGELRRRDRDATRPRLPIVALTAGAFEDDRRRCMEAGMDDFLTKPVMIDELVAMLEKWLAPAEAET